MPEGWDWLWIVLCLGVALLPPKWDPTIRLKEWLYERRCPACRGSGKAGNHPCGMCGGKGRR